MPTTLAQGAILMADKKPKYRSAKIDEEVVAWAEIVVSAKALEGVRTHVGEYLSGLLKGPVARDVDKALKVIEEHRKK